VLFPLLNVAPLVVRFVLLRQAPANPAVTTNEAVPFGTVRLVKIAAVPWVTEAGLPDRAPIATLAMPGPVPLMVVRLVVVSK
jgi:hypothetical protein